MLGFSVQYCHYVAGLVGIGLSKLFSASQLEDPQVGQDTELANSMGLFLQKTNIIRDYLEDTQEGRNFWPQEVNFCHIEKNITLPFNFCRLGLKPESAVCLCRLGVSSPVIWRIWLTRRSWSRLCLVSTCWSLTLCTTFRTSSPTCLGCGTKASSISVPFHK